MRAESRPLWNFDMSMDIFRFIDDGNIVKITNHFSRDYDTGTRYWVKLHRADGTSVDIPSHVYDLWFNRETGYFGFTAMGISMFHSTTRGREARNRLAAIKAYDKSDKAERTLYERLKKKFEPQVTAVPS